MVAFGDTILDVARIDEGSLGYRIGEGKAVRVPVNGDGLPDADGFTLVWAGAGGFWLAFVPSMLGVVIDRGGRRSLEQVAERRAIAADGARHLRLEEGETIWIEHGGVRFRVRLVQREALDVSTWSVERSYLGALIGSAVVILVALVLLRAQPVVPSIDEDEHLVVLTRLLELEPAEPATARQAIGKKVGRDYDPVARHIGILERLHDWPFVLGRGPCFPPKEVSTARFERVEVSGGMDREQVRRILRAHAIELHSCFEQVISELQGRVRVLPRSR